jgi:hypothetical protein
MPVPTASGALLLIGIAIAYSGLLTPFAARVYGRLGAASRTGERITYVEAHPGWWRWHNGAFALGAGLAGAALLLAADDTLSWAGATTAALGGAFGAAFTLWRVAVPPRAWWTEPQRAATTLYWAYTLLTLAGFALLGAWFLDGTAWLGGWLIAWNAGLAAYILWRRDLPPYSLYVPMIAAGIVLVA